MNIKHIFITTGISVLFGVYSIYNLFDYMKFMNHFYNKQILLLQNDLDEINKKYKTIEFEYVKIKEEILILSDKIINLETINEKKNAFLNSSNYDVSDDYEADEEDNDGLDDDGLDDDGLDDDGLDDDDNIEEVSFIPQILTESICDKKCYLKLATSNITMEDSILETDKKNDLLESDCIEIINMFDSNSLPCSKSFYVNPMSIRSRSKSVTEVDWLYKKIFR